MRTSTRRCRLRKASSDRQLDDVIAIQAVVTALGLHVDARRWRELEALFVPGNVELDYTSLHGGDVMHPSGREVVGAWESVLPGFTMTNHIIGPALVKITGLRASAEASVVGWHWIDDDTIAGGNRWIVGGRYTLGLEKHDDRWLITALKLTAVWQEGNKALLEEAAKRLLPPRSTRWGRTDRAQVGRRLWATR